MSRAALHRVLCRLAQDHGASKDERAWWEGALRQTQEALGLEALRLRIGEGLQFGPDWVEERGSVLDLSGSARCWTAPQLRPEDQDGLREHLEACLAWRSQWRDAQQRLVALNKLAAVGEFALGVAHELNTPLGAVMIQLDAANMALDRQRYDRAAEKVASAERAAEGAREIVAKLLFYSRSGGDGAGLVDLRRVVVDTLSLLGKQLSYDNLALAVEASEAAWVWGRANELQQVFTNLLLNARDAVLEQEPAARRLTVEIAVQDDEVLLRLTDSGPGVPEALRERLFEPFFTTKSAGQGTGLGLSVSSQIMSQHGGRLTVENVPAGGARFTMRLPRASGES